MRHEFKIEVARGEDAVRVRVGGELDLAAAPALDARLREAEAGDESAVVIDLTEVSFIDSTGLRVLLAAHARSQLRGDRLLITGAGEQAQRLFELAGVAERLPFGPG